MTTVEENERLALILEECTQRVQRGEPLEQCLASYPPEYREELSQLVPLAGRLNQLSRDPSHEFQARLEERLGASVDAARRRQKSGPLASIGRFFVASPVMRVAAVALVALLVLFGSGFGIVQAAEGSLPDSPLYQVKSAREWAERALAGNGESLVGVQARQVEG